MPERDRGVGAEAHDARRPFARGFRAGRLGDVRVKSRKLAEELDIFKHHIEERKVKRRSVAPDEGAARHVKDVGLFEEARGTEAVACRLDRIVQTHEMLRSVGLGVGRPRRVGAPLVLHQPLLNARESHKDARVKDRGEVEADIHLRVQLHRLARRPLELVRRVDQLLVHALLDIALRIVFVVVAQAVDLVDKDVKVDAGAILVGNKDHLVQLGECVKVVVLGVDHKDDRAHLGPWDLHGALRGWRDAGAVCTCRKLLQCTARHIPNFQLLEGLDIQLLRAGRRCQEQGIVGLVGLVYDFA